MPIRTYTTNTVTDKEIMDCINGVISADQLCEIWWVRRKPTFTELRKTKYKHLRAKKWGLKKHKLKFMIKMKIYRMTGKLHSGIVNPNSKKVKKEKVILYGGSNSQGV